MRGHARVSALIRMDIVQLREHHLRRARAHPLILSTFLPAEAMPPSGHPLILSKESAASVAASASLSSPRTWALGPSLALLVSWACGSWSSHAHPLASCFFSLALLVSLNSFVYLRERHISWGFSALGAFEGSCSESWSLGLAVLEPHAHAFVWYFFSLVWLVSLVVISLVVISLVGLYL